MRAVLSFDASPGANGAATLVERLAWPADSVVRVVAVVEPSAVVVPGLTLAPSRAVYSAEIDAQIVEHLQREVEWVVRRLTVAGLRAEGVVLRGRPATVIADEAVTFEADVLVAGSRGQGPIASLVLGSVSGELVDHAPCPVLVARRPGLERVLFATDASTSAQQAEELLRAWPIFEATPIRVLSVADVARPWHAGIAPTMHRHVLEAFEQDLSEARVEHAAIAEEVAARLRAAGRVAEVAMRDGDAAAEIVADAAEWSADLIVLGSRGRTGLTRALLGSVARNVLLGTDASVLVVRAPESA